MSTGVEPQQPNATPTNVSAPNATSPSPAVPGGTSPASPSPDFRYGTGSDVPSWAQGKTPHEVLGIAQQLEGVVRNHISPQQPQQQTYNQPTGRDPNTGQFTQGWQAPAPSTPAIADTDYLTGADIRREAPRLINEALEPRLAGIVEMTAQSNLAHVKRDFSTIFEKYGPEVYGYLARVPKNNWTVDLLTQAVKLVRADHVDELASEIASQRLAGMEPTLRSNGSPVAPVASTEPKYTLQSEAIPQDWKDRAAKAGLTESAVDEFCRANDISREQFFLQFGTTAITEARR